jgi:peroxiredoxin
MRWLWLTAQTVPPSLAALARHEFLVSLRERAGWAGLVIACAIAFADAALRPLSPLVGSIRATQVGGTVLGFVAIIFVAGAARRDDATSAADVIGSRPFRAPLLLLARLIGNYGLAVLGLLAVTLSALLPSLVFGGRWPSPWAPVHVLARGVTPLFFLVALTYLAVSVARNVLAAAIVAVYWLFIVLWGDYLARVFNFTLSQNAPTYGLLGASFVLGALAWSRWLERVGDPPRVRRLLPLGAVALFALGILNAYQRVMTSHDKPLHADPLALSMAAQHIVDSPRVPGFWLPDQTGHDWRLSSEAGKVIVLMFWSPQVPQSVEALESLRAVQRELGPAGVAPVAVCLADDHAISGHIAREGRFPFPMVTDTGTHLGAGAKPADESPIAEAYDVSDLPNVFLTDRGRHQSGYLGASECEKPELVIQEARRALTVPPPPS